MNAESLGNSQFERETVKNSTIEIIAENIKDLVPSHFTWGLKLPPPVVTETSKAKDDSEILSFKISFDAPKTRAKKKRKEEDEDEYRSIEGYSLSVNKETGILDVSSILHRTLLEYANGNPDYQIGAELLNEASWVGRGFFEGIEGKLSESEIIEIESKSETSIFNILKLIQDHKNGLDNRYWWRRPSWTEESGDGLIFATQELMKKQLNHEQQDEVVKNLRIERGDVFGNWESEISWDWIEKSSESINRVIGQALSDFKDGRFGPNDDGDTEAKIVRGIVKSISYVKVDIHKPTSKQKQFKMALVLGLGMGKLAVPLKLPISVSPNEHSALGVDLELDKSMITSLVNAITKLLPKENKPESDLSGQDAGSLAQNYINTSVLDFCSSLRDVGIIKPRVSINEKGLGFAAENYVKKEDVIPVARDGVPAMINSHWDEGEKNLSSLNSDIDVRPGFGASDDYESRQKIGVGSRQIGIEVVESLNSVLGVKIVKNEITDRSKKEVDDSIAFSDEMLSLSAEAIGQIFPTIFAMLYSLRTPGHTVDKLHVSDGKVRVSFRKS